MAKSLLTLVPASPATLTRRISLRSRGLRAHQQPANTLHNSSEKEEKLIGVYERLQEELDAQLELTVVSSELPPSERLRVIENLLRTRAGRSSLAKKPVLQDAN